MRSRFCYKTFIYLKPLRKVMGFKELWELRPLIGKNRHHMKYLYKLLDKDVAREIKKEINRGNISLTISRLGISKEIGPDYGFPTLNPKKPEWQDFSEEMNLKIEKAVIHSRIPEFTKKARVIENYVGFRIYGLKKIKKVLTLLLFAKKDPFNVLLLGDPGTGKTAFLHNIEKLYPKTALGLGSGTTGAGLGITMDGNEIRNGLLPMADNGICLIDELNLMKKEDYGALYSAMEKGFVSYDKKGKHIKLDARVRLVATANPIGGKFRGNTFDAIARQLPFEPALLSRFTVIFLLRKPGKNEFVRIAEQIVKDEKKTINENDIEFLREYIKTAEEINVKFPKVFEKEVSSFASKLKDNEDRFFFDVSPRIIHGLINISKAYARMELRDTVTENDLTKAKQIILDSLKNKLD